MDAGKILTIVIPTFNRADSLSTLLCTLEQEIANLEGRVDVIVGDNASADRTPEVTREFARRCRWAQVVRHPSNLGPEENFCQCMDRVKTRFFWIIGDDDLPKRGVIAGVVRLLGELDPDLLQLGTEGRPEIRGAEDGRPVTSCHPARLEGPEFASAVNVWVTFISGMVVNRERLFELNPELDIRRFIGTSLVQLGWVLPLMISGDRLFVVPEPCVLATSGFNTGGYKLITVFASNLPAIVDQVCGPASAERRGILRPLAWSFVPSLLWHTRFGDASAFASEDLRAALEPLRQTGAYRLLMLPILVLPKPLAFPFWIAARAFGALIRAIHAPRPAAAAIRLGPRDITSPPRTS